MRLASIRNEVDHEYCFWATRFLYFILDTSTLMYTLLNQRPPQGHTSSSTKRSNHERRQPERGRIGRPDDGAAQGPARGDGPRRHGQARVLGEPAPGHLREPGGAPRPARVLRRGTERVGGEAPPRVPGEDDPALRAPSHPLPELGPAPGGEGVISGWWFMISSIAGLGCAQL
jgi:hypothetical protein